ncbi:probable 28S ribosomal protein S6, mitochondrial [Neodiprion virginianus]|uniref:probable 28S ribosomal protein S6, mitochondrial n=1 Tax=Neodiprion fabricii TaxID=2872261 RepID=UPI001ED8C4A1|nr:probable 28S ribosomal protein S6, mitochondrial [Neodiprion fabricii]XP_046626914.1 probable 28S ribosomal protein S6, mitochondrial [Neodiprion virginianus]
MPTYELAMLLRVMPKTDIVSTLKRTANTIFSTGGIIRKIDSLGFKKMPFKTSAHSLVHREANYFIIYFDAPPSKIFDLDEAFGRDVDVVRRRIYKQDSEPPEPCTLADEIKPPPYRSEVQKMLEMAKKAKKPQFSYNTGLDYYPFQK